jgi:hypothetical protein
MSDDRNNLDLTDEEKRALIALLRETLEYARFPLAPRLDPLKAILVKLDPPPPKPEPLPPLRPGMGPTHGRHRQRRKCRVHEAERKRLKARLIQDQTKHHHAPHGRDAAGFSEPKGSLCGLQQRFFR